MSWGLLVTREPIEVTLAGILPPYIPSYSREFIPGLPDYWLMQDGEKVRRLTEEQFIAYRDLFEKAH